MSKSRSKLPKAEWSASTTLVEVPQLSEAEREELIASIRQAEIDIEAGRGLRMAAHEFGPWLDKIAREARERKQDKK